MRSHLSSVAVVTFCLAAAAGPLAANAHEGLDHDGCAAGQVFAAGDLEITGAFSRATLPAAKVAGGYLTIENRGTGPDRLLGGSTEAAERLEVHQMEMDGDTMKMSRVEGGLELPPGETVTLAPGGLHLMLIGLASPFTEGECLEVTLQFAQAGEVPVVLNIGGIAADAAPDEHAGH
ncbi:MAG TPA: copper chaperone PCu(A)C [Devosiaceae bacterium]|jgi:hypothetical protein|nr:copper chaperone PCu(A)C [Devosiaceae bacterium]